MTIHTDAERAAARDELLAIAAEWRGYSMPLDAQRRFDELDQDMAAYDAKVAEAAAQAAIRPPGPAPAPLAAKFTAIRNIGSDAERLVAVADMQELAATYRGYGMPVEAQRAFDMLVHAIDGYNAEAAIRAAAPPDPRDAVLAEMRERAGNAPPPAAAAATPSYWESVLAQGRACRSSRLN